MDCGLEHGMQSISSESYSAIKDSYIGLVAVGDLLDCYKPNPIDLTISTEKYSIVR